MRRGLILLALMTLLISCSHRKPPPSSAVCPRPERPSETVRQSLRDCCTILRQERGEVIRRWQPGMEELGAWLARVAVLNNKLEACRKE